jgi:DNA-binding HxlR family transcriptional regulator
MKMRNEYTCPLELTHDIIKGKWKPIILWELSKGSSSLSVLKKSIRGISQKMLVQHLKELQEWGMIGNRITFSRNEGKRFLKPYQLCRMLGSR